MKYILTFIGGVTVGLLTAIGIIVLDEEGHLGGQETIGEDEEAVIQEATQTDEGGDHNEDGAVQEEAQNDEGEEDGHEYGLGSFVSPLFRKF